MAKKKKKSSGQKSAEGRSKQAIIVEVYKANPDMSTDDALAKIKAEYGVDIKPAYYQVTTSNYRLGKIDDQGKSTGQGQPTKKKGTRKKATAKKKATTKTRRPRRTAANDEVSMDTLTAAKAFADQYESFEDAREALTRVGEFLTSTDDVEAATEAINALESLQS